MTEEGRVAAHADDDDDDDDEAHQEVRGRTTQTTGLSIFQINKSASLLSCANLLRQR